MEKLSNLLQQAGISCPSAGWDDCTIYLHQQKPGFPPLHTLRSPVIRAPTAQMKEHEDIEGRLERKSQPNLRAESAEQVSPYLVGPSTTSESEGSCSLESSWRKRLVLPSVGHVLDSRTQLGLPLSVHRSLAPSNDPVEDAHFAFFEPESRSAVLGVLDGHGGDQCSAFARRTLPSIIATHLQRLGPPPPTPGLVAEQSPNRSLQAGSAIAEGGEETVRVGAGGDTATDASVWQQSARKKQKGCSEGRTQLAGVTGSAAEAPAVGVGPLSSWLENLRRSLVHAFVETDLRFRNTLTAPSTGNNTRDTILRRHYNAGACGLVVVVAAGHVISANAGDSRAVLASAVPVDSTAQLRADERHGEGKCASSSSSAETGAVSEAPKAPSPSLLPGGTRPLELLDVPGLTHTQYATLAGTTPVVVRPNQLTKDHSCRNPLERAAVHARTTDPQPFRAKPLARRRIGTSVRATVSAHAAKRPGYALPLSQPQPRTMPVGKSQAGSAAPSSSCSSSSSERRQQEVGKVPEQESSVEVPGRVKVAPAAPLGMPSSLSSAIESIDQREAALSEEVEEVALLEAASLPSPLGLTAARASARGEVARTDGAQPSMGRPITAQSAAVSSPTGSTSHDKPTTDEAAADTHTAVTMLRRRRHAARTEPKAIRQSSMMESTDAMGLEVGAVDVGAQVGELNGAQSAAVAKSSVRTAKPSVRGRAFDRLAGIMMVTRAFGNAFLKWPGYSAPIFEPHLPYLSAVPEVTIRRLQPEDLFIVVACDGVWENVSNQQVIDSVTGKLYIDHCVRRAAAEHAWMHRLSKGRGEQSLSADKQSNAAGVHEAPEGSGIGTKRQKPDSRASNMSVSRPSGVPVLERAITAPVLPVDRDGASHRVAQSIRRSVLASFEPFPAAQPLPSCFDESALKGDVMSAGDGAGSAATLPPAATKVPTKSSSSGSGSSSSRAPSPELAGATGGSVTTSPQRKTPRHRRDPATSAACRSSYAMSASIARRLGSRIQWNASGPTAVSVDLPSAADALHPAHTILQVERLRMATFQGPSGPATQPPTASKTPAALESRSSTLRSSGGAPTSPTVDGTGDALNQSQQSPGIEESGRARGGAAAGGNRSGAGESIAAGAVAAGRTSESDRLAWLHFGQAALPSLYEGLGGDCAAAATDNAAWRRRLVDPRLSDPAARVVGVSVMRAAQRRKQPMKVRALLRTPAGKKRRGLVDDITCLVAMLPGAADVLLPRWEDPAGSVGVGGGHLHGDPSGLGVGFKSNGRPDRSAESSGETSIAPSVLPARKRARTSTEVVRGSKGVSARNPVSGAGGGYSKRK